MSLATDLQSISEEERKRYNDSQEAKDKYNEEWRASINKPIIRDIYDYIYVQRTNCLMGITGRVGKGKSYTAVHIGALWDKDFSLKDSLVYTVQELIEKTIGTINYNGKPIDIDFIKNHENIMEWLKENQDDIKINIGKVIIFDEAGRGAYVREFFSTGNRTLAKIIQVWRFLRLLVIFVIPEKIKLADSTISLFMNLEILMTQKKNNQAFALCYEYIGFNEKKNQVIKKRLQGNRSSGRIIISKLPKQLALEYEERAKYYKLGSLFTEVTPKKDKGVVDAKKRIEDITAEVAKNPEPFTNKRGVLDGYLISNHYQIPQGKAFTVIRLVERDYNSMAMPIATPTPKIGGTTKGYKRSFKRLPNF